MNNQLIVFGWMTATAAIAAIVIMAFFDFLLKSRIVKSGHLDDNYIKLLQQPSEGLSNLKWGILLLFAGIGLVIVQFVPYYADQSPIPWGIEMIFIAAGFICYYFVAKNRI